MRGCLGTKPTGYTPCELRLNHARGVYIIRFLLGYLAKIEYITNTKCCISSSRRRCTLKRDDMLAIGEMICRLRRMIYQVCDLDKKITASEEAVICWWSKLNENRTDYSICFMRPNAKLNRTEWTLFIFAQFVYDKTTAFLEQKNLLNKLRCEELLCLQDRNTL